MIPSPKRVSTVNKVNDWQVYHTRFLVKAKQLTEPLVFIDPLGREHAGQPGDYLVEWSNGLRRILPQSFFEDAYVSMGPADDNWISKTRGKPPVSTYQVAPSRSLSFACDS